MKDKKTQKVVKKKIKPYPFDSVIEKNGARFTIGVLKLVVHGLIIDMKDSILKPADNLTLELVLPANKGTVHSKVRVIKTYDQYVGAEKGSQAVRMAELHFVPYPLPEAQRLKVKDFLEAIRQESE